MGSAADFDAYAPPTLATPRFVLEPLGASHAEHLFEPFSDARLYAFMPGDPPQSVKALRERYQRLELRRSPDRSELWLNWAAKDRHGNYVGLVEATVRTDRSLQIAYFVFTAHQRLGVGVETVGTVMAHLSEALHLTSARALVDTRNTASWRLLERLGFHRRRRIDNADHFKGAASDEFEYVRDLGPGAAAHT